MDSTDRGTDGPVEDDPEARNNINAPPDESRGALNYPSTELRSPSFGERAFDELAELRVALRPVDEVSLRRTARND
jgi:hypothetical protein